MVKNLREYIEALEAIRKVHGDLLPVMEWKAGPKLWNPIDAPEVVIGDADLMQQQKVEKAVLVIRT